MLDRNKLVVQIKIISDHIFYDISLNVRQLEEIWKEIVADATAQSKLLNTPCAAWIGKINDAIAINSEIATYSIISVDGSQIYPDRHQGTLCYLINIGFVQLSYGFDYKKVIFNSKPQIFLPEENSSSMQAQDIINYQRQERELQEGIEQGIAFKQQFPDIPFVVLFDGALLFGNIEKDEEKKLFIDKYLSLLYHSFSNKIFIASYTSLPRSKELLTIVTSYHRLRSTGQISKELFDNVVDSHLVALFLKPNERTTIFISNYFQFFPQNLKLCFFYLHCGSEIVRVELPFWMACDDRIVNQISSMILNQTYKGFGYPVCLMEAHEQAVVKGPDREFFYQMISTFSHQYKQHIVTSQKSLKKRRINI